MLHGFNPDAKIIGLKEALAHWNMGRFVILWKTLLQTPKIISGEIKFAKYKNQIESAVKSIEYTEVGKLCFENNWLPDKEGGWHKPNELVLTDLPDEFETSSTSAREVAEKLGMKKPEVEKAINIIAGNDPNKINRLERFLSASDAEQEKMLKQIPQEIPPQPIPPQPVPPFKEGLNSLNRPQRGSFASSDTDNSSYPLTNPERY